VKSLGGNFREVALGEAPCAASKPFSRRIFAGQIPDPRTRRQKGKVFWFFSSEKNRIFFCLTKKKQKDF
jgi:hypothetical protein